MLMDMMADLPFDQAVKKGLEIEGRILDQLRTKFKYDITHSSLSEDKINKIDGYWVGKNGVFSVQVKYRESGDDFLYEIVKNVRRLHLKIENGSIDAKNPEIDPVEDIDIIGRDYIGEARAYLHCDRIGVARLFLAEEIKAKVKDILKIILKNPSYGEWHGPEWKAITQIESRNGNLKFIVFFKPEKLQSCGQWQLDIKQIKYG